MTSFDYRNAVVASGPLAYWPLTEPAGTTLPNEIVAGLASTRNGGPVFGTSDPWGQPGACTFVATRSDAFLVNSQLNMSTATFTLECWGRVAVGNGYENNIMVLQNAGQAVTTNGVAFEIWNGTSARFAYYAPGVGNTFAPITGLGITNDGGWHHYAWTCAYDGTLLLYVDGVQVSNNAGIKAVQAFRPSWLSMGGYRAAGGGVSNFTSGDFCHMAFYARALSVTEIGAHYAAQPAPPVITPPPTSACPRRAWLTMGALSVPLESAAAGYFLESLDLGYPAPRVVSSDLADQDGAVDRTAYMGPRTVTASVHALTGADAQIDAVASAFGPFMVPSARPVLHYVLDRPGLSERTLTLRPANYDWPIVGPYERAIALQWVAPDPIVRDPAVQTATAWSGGAGGGGRTYDLTFPRQYPTTGGPSIVGQIKTNGEVPARPVLRIYGPITGATVTFRRLSDNGVCGKVAFTSNYQIVGGAFVEVDSKGHTAYLNGDRTQPVLSALDWLNMQWPVVPIAPDAATMALAGSPSGLVTSGVTQCQASWHDGYLT